MKPGLEVFVEKSHVRFRKMRLGVLCNQASVDKSLRHASEVLTQKKLKLNITCFIGPQHGIRGEKQDNMVESDDFIDPKLNLPVYSLYGKTRQPTDDILDKVDAIVVDLQDIGTRIYTFMYTMAYCMQGAKRKGKKVIVLDRPNPIDGIHAEGNVLESGFSSFVGLFPIPTRHGLTMGELALLFNNAFGIGCDLEIIKLQGWKRLSYGDDWGRDWVPPSPNIPNVESALIFPGGVHFEGTNVSEGRGTTKPFEFVGAPYIDADALAKTMNDLKLPGVFFRAIYFQPTYQKCKDEVCGGVQIHVTDRNKFNSFKAGVTLLYKIAETYPEDFEWKRPPYEYEHDRMPIDLITGTPALREAVDQKKGLNAFFQQSDTELKRFLKLRKDFLLYK
jgi:uncharacterized protein YbbC (DUF1343 family)